MRVHAYLVAGAAVLAVLSGCDSCQPPAQTVGLDGAGKTQPVAGEAMPAGAKKVHKARPPVMAEATITARSGDVLVERSESTSAKPGLAARQDHLFVGDSVITGPGASVTLDIGQGSELVVGPSSRLSMGIFRPQEIVLHVGTASFSGEAIKGLTRRFMVMTPGGLVFYAGPAMEVAVAASGEVLVDVKDCPPREAIKTTTGIREARARCTFITNGGEQDLVTGDKLVIGQGLEASKVWSGNVAPEPAAWVKERAESLGEDPSAAAGAYAQWIGAALGDIRSFLDELKTRRERSKELLKKLRDLRKAGQPDPSKAAAATMKEGEEAPTEIVGVQVELSENSSQQYKLRHQLLARFYQVSLHLQLLGDHLDAEVLSDVGKTPGELMEAVNALGLELYDLIARKVRHKTVSKVMPKHLGTMPGLREPPKKPVAKH